MISALDSDAIGSRFDTLWDEKFSESKHAPFALLAGIMLICTPSFRSGRWLENSVQG